MYAALEIGRIPTGALHSLCAAGGIREGDRVGCFEHERSGLFLRDGGGRDVFVQQSLASLIPVRRCVGRIRPARAAA